MNSFCSGKEELSLVEGSGSPLNCEPPLMMKKRGSINYFISFHWNGAGSGDSNWDRRRVRRLQLGSARGQATPIGIGTGSGDGRRNAVWYP